jgi:four helix bundle protein
LLEVTVMADEEQFQQFPHQKLDAYRAARELARIVFASRIRDRDLRDQAQRAVRSVFLQLSEGLPCDTVAMRRNYFARARDSLFELVACLDLAALIGAIDHAHERAAHAEAIRVRAMLVALLRRC